MVLWGRIELPTSPLPRVCSTTELPQHVGRDLDSLVVGRKSKNVPNLHNTDRPYRTSAPMLDPDQSFG